MANVTGYLPANDGSPVTHTSNTVVTTLPAPNPAFTLHKLQSIGGTFVDTTINGGVVGEVIQYQIVATNTGNLPLTFNGSFNDPTATWARCPAARSTTHR